MRVRDTFPHLQEASQKLPQHLQRAEMWSPQLYLSHTEQQTGFRVRRKALTLIKQLSPGISVGTGALQRAGHIQPSLTSAKCSFSQGSASFFSWTLMACQQIHQIRFRFHFKTIQYSRHKAGHIWDTSNAKSQYAWKPSLNFKSGGYLGRNIKLTAEGGCTRLQVLVCNYPSL